MVTGIRTWAMNVNDLARSEAFFRDTLGAEVVRRIAPSPEERARGRVDETHFQVGNFQIHLKDGLGGTSGNVPHHTLMCEWQDRDAARREVERSGAVIEKVREHSDGVGFSLYVRDPDDNQFELWYGK